MPAELTPEGSAPPSVPGLALPLAYGQLEAGDARELVALKLAIKRTLGLDCDSYKEPCLRRRLAVRMRARGIHQYAAYAQLLDQDEAERDRLLDAITINVSKFFRNHEVWDLLEKRVVPELFASRAPKIRIWSAGCAAGEEPYTIAMMLTMYAHKHGLQDKLRKFDILATDIDPGVMELARKGEYADFAFTEIKAKARELFFDEGRRIKSEIQRMVRFAPLDLMADPFPRPVHLIFCRNVVIYFERAVQETIFRKFHAALAPGGYLVLGKVETVFGAALTLYKPVATRERLFCKA